MTRLRAGFIACDGRRLCAEALPELINPDDWGFPIVSGRAVPPPLPADARDRPGVSQARAPARRGTVKAGTVRLSSAGPGPRMIVDRKPAIPGLRRK